MNNVPKVYELHYTTFEEWKKDNSMNSDFFSEIKSEEKLYAKLISGIYFIWVLKYKLENGEYRFCAKSYDREKNIIGELFSCDEKTFNNYIYYENYLP